jgi:DNA-binding GntR family transcriptional regulator
LYMCCSVIIDNDAVTLAPPAVQGEERPTLPTRVRETLEERILTGQLREGDQIVEYQLARELGISQTPVREALRTLERDGLVVTRPHRGTFVRRVSKDEAAERYTLGMELEAFAARLAMPRLTEADFRNLDEIVDEMAAAAALRSSGGEAFAHSVEMNVAFHRYLVERAGHQLLLKTWLSVNPLNWRFTTYTRLLNPDPVELAERHRSLIAAYRSGDQVLAAGSIRAHIWEVAERVLANLPSEEPKEG